MKRRDLQAIRNALARIAKEIAASNANAGMYGRGLSREGYVGGYETALQDVLVLAQSGCLPSTRGFWADGYDAPNGTAKRATPVMLEALRALETGRSLRGRIHASTFYALRRGGFIEDSDTITDAGRRAIADSARSEQ